jgi:phosphoribosyl-AMP cyclohydrolase
MTTGAEGYCAPRILMINMPTLVRFLFYVMVAFMLAESNPEKIIKNTVNYFVRKRKQWAHPFII